MTLDKSRRDAARTILDTSDIWDASTMRITANGMVTALRDANKTCAGSEDARYDVAPLDEMVTAEGLIRLGF